MKNNGKNAPERAQHSDPPDTPTEAPAMEPRPDFARLHGMSTEIRAIAPAYEWNLITVRDRCGVQTQWFAPFGERLTSEDLDTYRIAHLRTAMGVN